MAQKSNPWDLYKKFDELAKDISSDESDETDRMDQMDDIDVSNVPKHSEMFVSGWDDENDLIEPELNPHETPEKEFLWAATEDKPELVREILEKHPELINVKDKDGYTALHKAAYNDNHDLAEYLIQHGADLNARTEMQWTPLHSACKWNNPKLVALLLRYGADVNALSEGLQTPLHIAASVSNCRDVLVTLLMHDDIKTDVVNNAGDTAEQIARRTGLCGDLFLTVKTKDHDTMMET